MTEPELFAGGECGRPLPAGEVLHLYRFGQFCPVRFGEDQTPVTVGEISGEHPASALRGSRRQITFGQLLATLEQAEAVVADQYGARSVMAGGTARPIGIKPVTHKINHTVAEADLSAYLAEPWAMWGTKRVLFTMSAAEVNELTSTGRTIVEQGEPDTFVHFLITVILNRAATTTTTPVVVPDTTPTVETVPTTTQTTTPQPEYNPFQLLRPGDTTGPMLAVYFEWKQTWLLKGFSRGRLLQSLALAPQEETTIELFTWDRRKKTLEQSSSTESEQTMEDEEKTQDSLEVLREMTKKEEFELKAGGSLDVGYSAGPVNIKLHGDLNVVQSSDAATVTRNTMKAIQDTLHRSSAKVRTARSSKVTETTETGQEQRVTRKIRNPNMCHTLNIDYYEIQTHYSVITAFNEDAMRFCALIDNPVAETGYSHEYIRQHEGPLRDALIDRGLSTGFEAMRFLRARDVAKAEIAERREEREKEPLPTSPGPLVSPQTPITDEENAANAYLANLQTVARKILNDDVRRGLDLALTCIGDATKATQMGTVQGSPRPADLDRGKRWLAQQLLLRSFSQLTTILTDLSRAQPPAPQIRDWGPRLAAVVPPPAAMPKPSQLNLEPQEVKQGLLQPALYAPDGPDHVKGLGNWGWWWSELRRVGLFEAEDAGLGAMVEQFDKIYRAYLDAVKQKGTDSDQVKLLEKQQKNQNRLNDEDRLENDFPLREVALATERAEVLQKHLQEHAGHYSYAMFLALPPQEQLNHIEDAMSGLGGDYPPGYFQPRVVSQIADKLLVPLNHETIPYAQKVLSGFKDTIDVPQGDDTVLLPSPGMTVDTRLGRCSGCDEFIEQSRVLDLRLRVAQARQAEAEADRLERRNAAAQLDDPKPQIPRVAIETVERPPGKP